MGGEERRDDELSRRLSFQQEFNQSGNLNIVERHGVCQLS